MKGWCSFLRDLVPLVFSVGWRHFWMPTTWKVMWTRWSAFLYWKDGLSFHKSLMRKKPNSNNGSRNVVYRWTIWFEDLVCVSRHSRGTKLIDHCRALRFKSVNLLVKVKVSLKANGRHGNALLQVRFPRLSAWHRVWLSGYMVEFGDGCIMDDHYRLLKPYSKTQWNSLNILKLR